MAPPSFWLDSDAPEPLCGETLAPQQKSPAYTSTPGTGVKRGGSKVQLLLGCVRAAPRNTQNKVKPQLCTGFPPVRPKWEFQPISLETHLRESDDGEAANIPEWNLGHLQPKTHLYPLGVEPPNFWLDPDAP